ncbi:zinc finger protein Xfin-like [Pieris brassicae]|uniref:zinc finger protein Xfin-like n=1 Tax=Pieris brassicae TaxID=7116 RepID=UPI001E65FA04|nr:zinc finger protein Xfin-like [Pieris brassicae]XP_045516148.1 zinc finger protein Xfin-like [Pieris brassicae]
MTSWEALQILQKPLTTVEKVGGISCNLCKKIFKNKPDFDTHYTNHTGNKEVLYQCVVCSKEFHRYSAFRGHCYTNHVIKNRYVCTQCDKFFSKQYNLQQHIELVHGPQCKACMQKFPSKKELHLHQIVYHNESMADNSCQVCQEEILTVEACKQHIDLHLSQVYTCPICQETILHKNMSADHLKKHFWKKDFDENNHEGIINQLSAIACGLCSMICPNREEFDAHFFCDHASKDAFYTCILCGKQFFKYSAFHSHVNRHYADGRFQCDTCDKTFPNLSELVWHACECSQDYKKHKPYICFHCGNRYLLEHSLLKHITDSHNGFDLRCREPGCEQIFDKRRDLLLHSRHHEDRVQSWCRICGQDFTSLPSCVRHLEVHKKYLFACPLCSKSYAERSYLLKHIPTHFRAVLHVCKICGKIYDAKRRLLEHQKTHHEVKVHSCSRCPKTFAKKSHLLQHLNVHNKERDFLCVVCEKRFSCSPNLSKHQNRVHCVHSNRPVTRDPRDDAAPDPKIESSETDSSQNKDWYVYLNREMETNVIDEAVIEKESRLFESRESAETEVERMEVVREAFGNHNEDANDFKVLFKEKCFGIPSSSLSDVDSFTTDSVPREYGPEIASPGLDDYILPHIDPLLTILTDAIPDRPDPAPTQRIPDENEFRLAESWDPPLLTKIYSAFYDEYEERNRLSVKTDIF